MSIILETERLQLRQFELTDASFIFELLNSPGWIEYIGDRNIKTIESAICYLQDGPMKSYEVNGFGLWLVEIKEGHIPIGMCGILKRDTLDNPDIGFAFLPAFTGKGYAVEAAYATFCYAKITLKIETLYAVTTPTNTKSIQLLEKIGLQFIRIINFPTDNVKLWLYGH